MSRTERSEFHRIIISVIYLLFWFSLVFFWHLWLAYVNFCSLFQRVSLLRSAAFAENLWCRGCLYMMWMVDGCKRQCQWNKKASRWDQWSSDVNCGMFRWSAVKVSGWLCGHHKIRGILAICQWKQTTCFSSTAFRDCFRCFFHHDILCKLYMLYMVNCKCIHSPDLTVRTWKLVLGRWISVSGVWLSC